MRWERRNFSARSKFHFGTLLWLPYLLTFFGGWGYVLSGQTQNTFRLGPLKVEPGQVVSGFLEVPPAEDPATSIPLTVINGQKPGKVLGVVAGIHPYEYPPILASYRLKKLVDPASLSGTLILVHIAHLPSFQKRTIYYNPYDWKNLNRVFPGDPSGSQSQRIAAVLTKEVVERVDALIDCHCGDGNEALIPYTYWMISGNKEVDETSRQMALAFGIDHIIIDQTREANLKESKYLSWTAILRKIPSITTEMGYLGRVEEEAVALNVAGVLNVMKQLRMLPGEARLLSDPVWIDKYEVIYSKHSGLFYPRVKMGYHVREGQVIGHVEDYLGNWLEEVKAPFTGMILYIINTPPCNAGEPLFEVGRLKEK